MLDKLEFMIALHASSISDGPRKVAELPSRPFRSASRVSSRSQHAPCKARLAISRIYARRRARAAVGASSGWRRSGDATGLSASSPVARSRICALPRSRRPCLSWPNSRSRCRPVSKCPLHGARSNVDSPSEHVRQREIDAGVTYLSNEPIGDVSAVPIYREEYLLLTTTEGRSAMQIALRGRRRPKRRCAFWVAICRAVASWTASFGASASRRDRCWKPIH